MADEKTCSLEYKWKYFLAKLKVWGFISVILLFPSFSLAAINGTNAVILVNSNSPTSRYIAKIYRQYHPDVPAENVLYLTDMNDCSGRTATSGDEIITRSKFNSCIANPLRSFLLDANYPDRISQISVIITTAGMPYRIEDSTYPSVVNPHSSNGSIVQSNIQYITAASVESELTCLWHGDWGINPAGLANRIVNPYQGYRNSSISLFPRSLPGAKQMFWNVAICTSGLPPIMEGQIDYNLWPPMYGTFNRSFSAGDMYLVCRLDGPKNQGQSAVFSVRCMLERAKRASIPQLGVNPSKAMVVIDDVPSSLIDRNRIYNLRGNVNYLIYDANVNQPSDAMTICTKDDYPESFKAMVGSGPASGILNFATMPSARNINVIFDARAHTSTTMLDFADDAYALFYATYGVNGDEGKLKTYLLAGSADGTNIFNLCNGAVFTSLESFNAVTMFSDAVTSQAKIIDFISIGGCGAIGHAFEPISDAAIDNQFLFYNLLADRDNDGKADLTFVEAAYTAIPYLSWSEVVIGDPLMRICYGPGQAAFFSIQGDVNGDHIINIKDARGLQEAENGDLYNPDPIYFEYYNDMADFNQDTKINIKDSRILKLYL
ncbi:MAG: dockerin type I repeat-containing protein [Phycisphaerales bacterium]